MLWHTIINDYEALDLGTGIFGRLCGASEKWLLINRTPSNSISRSIDYLYFEISFNSKVNTFFSFQFFQSTLQLVLRFNWMRWLAVSFNLHFIVHFLDLPHLKVTPYPTNPFSEKNPSPRFLFFFFRNNITFIFTSILHWGPVRKSIFSMTSLLPDKCQI